MALTQGTQQKHLSGDRFVFIECTNSSAQSTPEAKALIRQRTLALARQVKLRGRRDAKASKLATQSRTDLTRACRHCAERGDVCLRCRVAYGGSGSPQGTCATVPMTADTSSTLPMTILPCGTQDPYGALAAGRAGDLAHLGQWFFYNQLDAGDRSKFPRAVTSFGTDLWEMARGNEPLLNCLIASVLRKKSYFLGREDDRHWLLYKGRVLSMIQQAITKGGRTQDPMLWVAIVYLATFDIGDKQLAVAVTHLRGLRDMMRMEKLTAKQWLYCAYTDFRVALLLNIKPVLPYYITPYYRIEPSLIAPYRPEARRLALHNCRFSPNADVFDPEASFELFRKLHELSLAWDPINVSEKLPFGDLYDLEYQVLSLNAEARTSRHASAFAVELLACAAELHALALTRFWTPQRKQTPLSVLKRALANVAHRPHLLADWQAHAHSSSLLWVLFALVLAMLGLQLDAQQPVPVLQHLRDTVSYLRIRSGKRFATELKKWPCLDHWHDEMAEKVWIEIGGDRSAPGGSWQRLTEDRGQPELTMSPKWDRLYIGVLQFYTGS